MTLFLKRISTYRIIFRLRNAGDLQKYQRVLPSQPKINFSSSLIKWKKTSLPTDKPSRVLWWSWFFLKIFFIFIKISTHLRKYTLRSSVYYNRTKAPINYSFIDPADCRVASYTSRNYVSRYLLLLIAATHNIYVCTVIYLILYIISTCIHNM